MADNKSTVETSIYQASGKITQVLSTEVIKSLPCFNPRDDPNTLSVRWKRWKRSFNLYLVAKGITQDAQKKALLLHTGGLDLQELYFTLEPEDETNTFDECLSVLDNYFVPKVNIPFERHLFRQMEQLSGEKVDQFVCRLRQKAATCDFENVDETIRDQLIEKCQSAKLRRKFLEKPNASLSDLQDIARVQEAVDVQMKTLEQRKPVEVNSVDRHDYHRKRKGYGAYKNSSFTQSSNRTHSRKHGTDQTRRCYNCNRTGHFARDTNCPARNQICNECGARGHFAVCCEKKCFKKAHVKSTDGGANASRKAYQVTGGEDMHYAFVVGKQAVVELEGVLIVSGASCNLMDYKTWNTLKENHVVCNSKKCDKRLFAYGQKEPIKVVGTFVSEIVCEASGEKCVDEFTVIN